MIESTDNLWFSLGFDESQISTVKGKNSHVDDLVVQYAPGFLVEYRAGPLALVQKLYKKIHGCELAECPVGNDVVALDSAPLTSFTIFGVFVTWIICEKYDDELERDCFKIGPTLNVLDSLYYMQIVAALVFKRGLGRRVRVIGNDYPELFKIPYYMIQLELSVSEMTSDQKLKIFSGDSLDLDHNFDVVLCKEVKPVHVAYYVKMGKTVITQQMNYTTIRGVNAFVARCNLGVGYFPMEMPTVRKVTGGKQRPLTIVKDMESDQLKRTIMVPDLWDGDVVVFSWSEKGNVCNKRFEIDLVLPKNTVLVANRCRTSGEFRNPVVFPECSVWYDFLMCAAVCGAKMLEAVSMQVICLETDTVWHRALPRDFLLSAEEVAKHAIGHCCYGMETMWFSRRSNPYNKFLLLYPHHEPVLAAIYSNYQMRCNASDVYGVIEDIVIKPLGASSPEYVSLKKCPWVPFYMNQMEATRRSDLSSVMGAVHMEFPLKRYTVDRLSEMVIRCTAKNAEHCTRDAQFGECLEMMFHEWIPMSEMVEAYGSFKKKQGVLPYAATLEGRKLIVNGALETIPMDMGVVCDRWYSLPDG